MKILKIIIVIWVIGAVIMIVQKVYFKSKISRRMDMDPESALQAVEDGLEAEAFTLDEYERELIRLSENTGYVGAMLKLVEFYSGKKYEDKKNEGKSQFWKERAVKAGDLESIMDYYGFSDYDVSSDNYNEMLQNLETAEVRASSEKSKAITVYLKGIVNYKMGNISEAKRLFASISLKECIEGSAYMLFRCFMRETNIIEAEKVLEKLGADGYEIKAGDYLDLYNYYVSRRDSDKPAYEMEMDYVQKYISCKDADSKIANEIGADTYYNVAKALQGGIIDFQGNKINDANAYEKAATFGHIEALYKAGMGFWTGKDHFGRNYNKANKYLLQAAQKGHEQAEKNLEQHGVEGVLLSPFQTVSTVYQFMGGYEIRVSKKVMKWLQLYHGLIYKAYIMKSEFINKYSKKIKSFDELIKGIHLLYADQVAEMLMWAVQALMFYGIDIYDVGDIMASCGDLSLLSRVPLFENGLKQIDNRASQLNMQLAYAQATRGYWSGAGIGNTIGNTIVAAAKASVAAGIMNMGSSILHGIGDSIVTAMNNSEIKEMEKELFENKNTIMEFAEAVFSVCIDIGVIVRKIIETECNIELNILEGDIQFDGERLSDIDDRTLRAKINNNLSIGNDEYVYALLIEKLRRNPLDKDVYSQILNITGRWTDNEVYSSMEQYGCDFGLV